MAPPLSRGSCPEARLDTDELHRIVPGLTAWLAPGNDPDRPHPWCAGAVVVAGRGPVVALHEAVGWAVRYAGYDEHADRGVELPREQWVPARPDTVFDLASVTKLFTAVVAVRQIERGVLRPDAPVASYAPELTAAAAHGVTLRHLLTHTSGLRPELPLYDEPDAAARAARLAAEEPLTPPGAVRTYSDLNLLLLQTVLERTAGSGIDRLVAEHVTEPLGMADTRFNPPASWLPRIAATEDQRRPWGKLDRGMVHGAVHDENAHAMGGVAGHAGLFSTGWDLAVFCRAVLDAAAGASDALLTPAGAGLLLGGARAGAGAGANAGAGAGGVLDGAPLGFERDQPWFMGELAGRGAVGHTGFTGTGLVLDPATDTFLVLLTNSVHPVRNWREGSGPRAEAATRLARAVR
ncbi:putative beta-lactamase [Actinacidiphila reveromycinica]|uniref:Putative beta-lactamase n=1 Tax=Actinacidiphila reveromycinica TaxID=659352 RepID=A0A7U3UMP5_9ACTN|nr:serine hydrolase domain-containing protein [Streptomyces sp. SN-593]BBA97080.1 putative beta-lactamase [Streptomyces sp. SN-593]